MNINQSSSVASTVDEVVKLCRACVDEFALNKRSALAVIQGNDDFNSGALREEIANYCITAGIPVYTLDDSVTAHYIAEKIDAASHGVVIKELKDRGVAIWVPAKTPRCVRKPSSGRPIWKPTLRHMKSSPTFT